MTRKYSDEQRAWLTDAYPRMTNAEMIEAWPWADELPLTAEAARSWGSNHHLRKAERFRFQRQRRKYSEEQLDWLRAYIPGHHEGEIIDAYEERFGERLTQPMVAGIKAKLGVISSTHGGRFEKGHPSPNKGRPMNEWASPEAREAMSKSWFQKGSLNGIAAERARPLLDIRETPDGYLQIKVAPRNARNSMGNWISLARFVWMQHNGRDFPENHSAVFADGDRRNFDPDNIVAVPRDVYAIITGRNHGHALPYHDWASLETAILHAQVKLARGRLERRRKK